MGLKEDINEIKVRLTPEVKERKKFKLPFKARVGKGKAKKNWVGILKINENGAIEPSKQQIIEQTVMVDGVPRLATPDYVLRWHQKLKQFPLLILPSWSVKPLSPTESIEKSLNDGSNIKGYKLLLNRMKLTAVDVKKPMGSLFKWIIGIGVGAIMGYALWTGGLG